MVDPGVSSVSKKLYLQNLALVVAVLLSLTALVWFIADRRDDGWLESGTDALGGAVGVALIALPLIFVGWALYLPLVFSLARKVRDRWKSRAIAVALSPINACALYVVLYGVGVGWEVVAYMLLFSLVYGSLVRLPEPESVRSNMDSTSRPSSRTRTLGR